MAALINHVFVSLSAIRKLFFIYSFALVGMGFNHFFCGDFHDLSCCEAVRFAAASKPRLERLNSVTAVSNRVLHYTSFFFSEIMLYVDNSERIGAGDGDTVFPAGNKI